MIPLGRCVSFATYRPLRHNSFLAHMLRHTEVHPLWLMTQAPQANPERADPGFTTHQLFM